MSKHRNNRAAPLLAGLSEAKLNMRFLNQKIHRIIYKQTKEASLLVIVALMVRPPPLGEEKESSRFDPYWLEGADRGFLVRIVVVKKSSNQKGESNDNQ